MIIHLVGAQKSNYPWGFENRLTPAIEHLGHTLISTDFRQERNRLSKLLAQKADLILVCKGENIDPQLIESAPCVTALWYAEQLGTSESWDETALARRSELSYNVSAFDYVFSHDPTNLPVYQELGAERVYPLPCAAVDPQINRKLPDVRKKYDVLFVGSQTPRRQKILDGLCHKGINVYAPNIWDAREINRLFNESSITLNIHLSDLINTETRVAEALGAGAFLLSETLSDPTLVQEGKHYASFPVGNVEDCAEKIKYYLGNVGERERIAQCGFHYIHANHTYAVRIQEILDRVDFSINTRIWPSYLIGVPRNKQGRSTLRLDRFQASVAEAIRTSCSRNVHRLGAGFSAVHLRLR